jgi:hypothetical protein
MKMHINGESSSPLRCFVLVVALFFAIMTSVWAGSEELRAALPMLSDAEYEQLSRTEMVYGISLTGPPIIRYFVPGTEAARRALLVQDIEKGFALGAVNYIPYTPALKAMDQGERQLAIFNKIRAISTQEGVTYISHRAGDKERTLIERSSYMEDDRNLNRLLPDPVVTVFPLTAHSYVYQRDTSFGGNRYEHTYTNSDREIFVSIENISSMKVLGIFTAVKSGQLSMNMGTYQLDDGLLLVALTSIEGRNPTVSVLGLSVDLPSAFRRRIVAVQNWLIDQLNTIGQ